MHLDTYHQVLDYRERRSRL